jgi:hypothetical protein
LGLLPNKELIPTAGRRDYARKMYPHYNHLNVPTWIIGPALGEGAVFISDLATELQIGVPKLHEWIRREVIESGHGSLGEGHCPTATERQRAAAIEHLGSRRLLIRF